MNFLLRPTHTAASDLPSIPESEAQKNVQPATTTLEGLISEDRYLNSSGSEDGGDRGSDSGGDDGNGLTSMNRISTGKHTDVSEDEGWITIPCKELPDGWTDASDIQELRSMDRSFVFPGEQLHILVCLSVFKQDTEAITPFKVAAVMSGNGTPLQNGKKCSGDKCNSLREEGVTSDLNEEVNAHGGEENGKNASVAASIDHHGDIPATRNILLMEDHKHQTEVLLEKFRNSNFFVRVAGSDEPLWSKRNEKSATSESQSEDGGQRQILKSDAINAVVDRGSFDGRTSGGVARNTATCYSLRNGDIAVLLRVNVGLVNAKDPVLEVLQFEKYQPYDISSDDNDHFLDSKLEDPCHELLNWLLPLDHVLPPRPLPSAPVTSASGVGISHQRSTSSSSASQIFSFSHFRSYSMPSLPQASILSSTAAAPSSHRTAYDVDDVQHYSTDKLRRSQDRESDKLLSFRGVSLEPQRFSVNCGLQGIYLPGRRWRRQLEIVQPVQIHSFAAECATEDLLCVQVKNISPAHLPDIIIYVDAITIIFEEASKSGQPISLPISSVETGNSHNLPNLPLRRGEEHSFIVKPATTMAKCMKTNDGANSQALHALKEGSRPSTSADQFAVVVSCRCNYTESKLFFKKPTAWRPRVARDLLISVASEPTEHSVGPNARIPQLPIQALTLQASNLTSENLTLTVLAPVSSTSPPSVVSLTSSPRSQTGTFAGFPEVMGRVGGEKRVATVQRLSSMPTATETQKEWINSGIRSISLGQRTGTAPDISSNTNLGCTHLWLQSTVPLGCVPAHSSATVKLELLPLTDGIITLDTLQIAVKEKGITYKPEQPLKIYATSENATAVVWQA